MDGALTLTNNGTIAGGNGGSGADASFDGSGGDGIGAGGSCVLGFLCNVGGGIAGAITLNNQAGGVVQGGNGAGYSGGGVGVRGVNVSIVNNGTIAGGFNGYGGQANAIVFASGTNSLELWRNSLITGNVVAAPGGSDTLILGGSDDSDLHLDDIGPGQQYQNFANFQKTGTSNWTLNGTTTEAMPWTVSAGSLVLGSGSSMGAASTVQVNAGATLDVMGPDAYTLQSLANNGSVMVQGPLTVGSYAGGASAAPGEILLLADLTSGNGTAFYPLTVTGTASGVTRVDVYNVNAASASAPTTGDGILLITTATPAAGSFVLGSVIDILTLAPITAYHYALVQGTDADAVHWYLRATQPRGGTAANATAVPALDMAGMGLLALLLAGAAMGMRRKG